jgi:hypothetical protein
MPSTRESPVSDLSALLKKLNEASVEFILVGGLAAVMQGVPITTFDLDIVHRRSDENIKRLFKFLKSVDAYFRRPDDTIIEPSKMDLSGTGHLLLTTCFGPLDILAVIEKDLGYHELLPSTVEIEYKGHKTYVLSLETIIKLKQGSTDPNEQYRLQIYKETLRLTRQR